MGHRKVVRRGSRRLGTIGAMTEVLCPVGHENSASLNYCGVCGLPLDPLAVVEGAYDLLEVAPGADESVVRAAFKARAKQVHPDLGGNRRDFQAVEAAFAMIEAAGFPTREQLSDARPYATRGDEEDSVAGDPERKSVPWAQRVHERIRSESDYVISQQRSRRDALAKRRQEEREQARADRAKRNVGKGFWTKDRG